MKASLKASAIGKIEIEKRNRNGEVTQHLAFDNVFLISGYKAIIRRLTTNEGYGGTTLNQYGLWLGTGTTEPHITDTGLENRSTTVGHKAIPRGGIAALTGNHGIEIGDNKVVCQAHRATYNYAEGEAEGVWTELGLGDSAYADPITRALIRDENGTPISLTVLSDEFLTVHYTFMVAVDKSFDLGSHTVLGTNHNVSLAYQKRSRVNFTVDFYMRWVVDGTFMTYQNLDRAYIYPAAATVDPDTGVISGFSTNNESDFTSTIVTLDADELGLTMSSYLDPTGSDVTIGTVVYCQNARNYRMFYLMFDPAVVKPADYRITFDLGIRFVPEGAPVRNVQPTATATTLDFTWDAYSNATSYELVLRQAGAQVATQTITAPTTTASFTGLTASTEYELQIKALTSTTYDGQSSLHTASTTA